MGRKLILYITAAQNAKALLDHLESAAVNTTGCARLPRRSRTYQRPGADDRQHPVAARHSSAPPGARSGLLATAAVPPDGDVYILSRVLHDWDDQQGRLILERCAEAMPPDAQLLILERLLPEDDSPSLAAAWDVHMLCNVGGRERTAGHYRRLLRESGFTLTGQHRLPLEFVVLQAIPRHPLPGRPDPGVGQQTPAVSAG